MAQANAGDEFDSPTADKTRLLDTPLETDKHVSEGADDRLGHRNQRLARSFVFSTAGDQSGPARKRARRPAISSE